MTYTWMRNFSQAFHFSWLDHYRKPPVELINFLCIMITVSSQQKIKTGRQIADRLDWNFILARSMLLSCVRWFVAEKHVFFARLNENSLNYFYVIVKWIITVSLKEKFLTDLCRIPSRVFVKRIFFLGINLQNTINSFLSSRIRSISQWYIYFLPHRFLWLSCALYTAAKDRKWKVKLSKENS